MTDTKQYDLHLMGEIPHYGHGRKIVHVEQIGWKWVYVRKVGRATRIKIRRSVWNKLLEENGQ